MNAVVDALRSYNGFVRIQGYGFLAPMVGQLKFFPLFILGMLKHVSFIMLTYIYYL